MSEKIPPLESIDQFLFQVPLYAKYHLDLDRAKELYPSSALTVDGHCVECGREAPFAVPVPASPHNVYADIEKWVGVQHFEIRCTREDNHRIRYWFLIDHMVLEKIGQHPSLADIANDEVKVYRKLLSAKLANEFSKAIGLAAHRVGIGSFVYLRRVFERLISDRFEEFKDTEDWDFEKFQNLRMEDKIKQLKDHLPEFLVSNRRIYSILSKGIHELSEEACLGYFDAMRQSIIIILEDDKKAREDKERREVFQRTIADFDPQAS